MTNKIVICDKCGSDQISIEAFVFWRPSIQDFEIGDICDKGHNCINCGETTITYRDMTKKELAEWSMHND